MSHGHLGEVTDKLELTREKHALAEKNREQERRMSALEKRVSECDSILDKKNTELQKAVEDA